MNEPEEGDNVIMILSGIMLTLCQNVAPRSLPTTQADMRLGLKLVASLYSLQECLDVVRQIHDRPRVLLFSSSAPCTLRFSRLQLDWRRGGL